MERESHEETIQTLEVLYAGKLISSTRFAPRNNQKLSWILSEPLLIEVNRVNLFSAILNTQKNLFMKNCYEKWIIAINLKFTSRSLLPEVQILFGVMLWSVNNCYDEVKINGLLFCCMCSMLYTQHWQITSKWSGQLPSKSIYMFESEIQNCMWELRTKKNVILVENGFMIEANLSEIHSEWLEAKGGPHYCQIN